MTPLVSIVVNCYNQARYLERSVKSVLAQTFTDLECIIVDDGSTDNTRQVAQSLMSLDGRVRYCDRENGGLPSARNFGVELAKGEWIQCLDADDWISEDKTKFQLEHLEKSVKQGTARENLVLYCDYERVYIDKEERIADREPNLIGPLDREQLIRRLLIPDFLADSPHPALQQCMLMHKSIFRQNRFPEKLKALGDRYFGVQILKSGVAFVYAPIVGAFYTKHQGNRTNNWNYMKNYYTQFYEKVAREYRDLRPLCGLGLEYLINEAVRDKEAEQLERLAKILATPIALKIWNQAIPIGHPAGLRLVYALRAIAPSFLLYEKYQGPRSKKVIDKVSKLLEWIKAAPGKSLFP